MSAFDPYLYSLFDGDMDMSFLSVSIGMFPKCPYVLTVAAKCRCNRTPGSGAFLVDRMSGNQYVYLLQENRLSILFIFMMHIEQSKS